MPLTFKKKLQVISGTRDARELYESFDIVSLVDNNTVETKA